MVKMLSMVLVLSILFLTLSVGASAANPVDYEDAAWDEMTQDDGDIAEQYINLVEEELGREGYTVESALLEMVDLWENEYDIRYVREIASEIIDDYNDYKQQSGANNTAGLIPFFLRVHLYSVYKAAVAAAVALFFTAGCYLSAEMLLFARLNSDENTTMTPVFSNRLAYSDEIQEIASGPIGAGEKVFPFPSLDDGILAFAWQCATNRLALDLASSIHAFYYEKVSEYQIVITDIYNFDHISYTGGYPGHGIAFGNNTMYWAMRLGILVSYHVSIDINI